MSKGLAVKMVFWVIIFLVVCIVATYLMMDIYKQAGNVSIWGDYRQIKEEEDLDAVISEVEIFDSSNREISDYLLKTGSDTFKVSFGLEVPEGSNIEADDQLKIEIRGSESSGAFEPCTFTISGLKPKDDFIVDSSTKGCSLAVKPEFTGRVSVYVLASLNERLIDDGYKSFEARLSLSSLASTPAAFCSLIKSYIDNWEKDDVSMVNDWDTLRLEAKVVPKGEPGDCAFSDRITLAINGVECPDVILKCTGLNFYLNSRTVPYITSGSINVPKNSGISIYNTIGKEQDPVMKDVYTSVRLTFIDTTG